MPNTARFFLAVISAISSLFLAGKPIHSTTSAEPAPVGSYTPEQQDLITFALGRFEQAGLSLPAVTIVFPDYRRECHGYAGIYEPDLAKVSVCVLSDTTMVHELAHAWVESTLTAAERDEFIDMRGLDTWAGGSEWDQRGAEHAAEIITWALMDRDISIRWIETDEYGHNIDTRKLFKIPNSHPNLLFSAFFRLTGQEAINRVADQGQLETTMGDAVTSPEAIRAGR